MKSKCKKQRHAAAGVTTAITPTSRRSRFSIIIFLATALVKVSSASIVDSDASTTSRTADVEGGANNEVRSCGTVQPVDDTDTYAGGDEDAACNDDGPSHDLSEGSLKETRPVWWNYTIDELFEIHFECATILYGYDLYDRRKLSLEESMVLLRRQWAHIRDKYNREVGPFLSLRGGTFTNNDEDNAATDFKMAVPTHVADAGPEKGRGVFSTGPIRKGALIHYHNTRNTGVFHDGRSWRNFVVSLDEEDLSPDEDEDGEAREDGGGGFGGVSGREMACNVIEWSWVQYVPDTAIDVGGEKMNDGDVGEENGKDEDDAQEDITRNSKRPIILIDFGESSLMNNAEWDSEVEANVRCGSPPSSWYQEGDKHEQDDDEWSPCLFSYHATRDITAGEELLVDYSDFEEVSQEGWRDLGL